jgi:hypothetical protein
MSENNTVSDFVEALTQSAQSENNPQQNVVTQQQVVPTQSVQDIKQVDPIDGQSMADPNRPNDKELLAFYRYKEKMREEAMLADPFLPVKSALSESGLEKREQLALLEKIQEMQEKSGLKDMAQLAELTRNYAIPEFIRVREEQRKSNDVTEAVNFKWAIDSYGEWGRKSLESFKAFAREHWGDATPEYMRHDLFRERFPAFIEKNLGRNNAQEKEKAAMQAKVDWIDSLRGHKNNNKH